MIEYEIKFTLPENVAEVFDTTRRKEYMQKRVADFIGELVAEEVSFVTERAIAYIHPTIGRVEQPNE